MTTYDLFNQSLATATTRSDGPYNLGTEFVINQTCWVTGFRFRRPNTTAQTVTAQLWKLTVAASTVWMLHQSSVTFSLGSTTGWKTVMLSTPVKCTYSSISN